MKNSLSLKSQATSLDRRNFLFSLFSLSSIGYLPLTIITCQNNRLPQNAAINTPSIDIKNDIMEEALVMMSKLGPFGNHGPMAAEALIALGHSDKVISYVESYKKRFTNSHLQRVNNITSKNWQEALGKQERVTDWTNFFNGELKESPWPKVLEKWSAILAPGFAALATHGVIRTGHAARSLSIKESTLRLQELAQGLASWAAYYQAFPETLNAKNAKLKPAEALSQTPIYKGERSRGSIMRELEVFQDFAPFTKVATLIDTSEQAKDLISLLTETFTEAYLKNVAYRNAITLVHAVTSTTALRSLIAHLSKETTEKMLRYAWQTSAALYSLAAIDSPNTLPSDKDIKPNNLTERAAISNQDHVIKFTEACLREYKINPNPIYLQAAKDAIERL